MAKLDGKIALITGASTGIGFAIAKRFVAEGAQVFIVGRGRDELEQAKDKLGANVTALTGDASRLDDLDRIYETVEKTAGRLDVVVANAAAAAFNPLGKITPEEFDSVFNLNVRGTLFTVQKALPLLGAGGSIVLVGSIAGVKGLPGGGVYGASKAALRQFVRSWTAELKDRGIRANLLSPGPVLTEKVQATPSPVNDAVVKMVPMGRMASTDEIASAALFLASAEASYVTGIELFADGGLAQV